MYSNGFFLSNGLAWAAYNVTQRIRFQLDRLSRYRDRRIQAPGEIRRKNNEKGDQKFPSHEFEEYLDTAVSRESTRHRREHNYRCNTSCCQDIRRGILNHHTPLASQILHKPFSCTVLFGFTIALYYSIRNVYAFC